MKRATRAQRRRVQIEKKKRNDRHAKYEQQNKKTEERKEGLTALLLEERTQARAGSGSCRQESEVGYFPRNTKTGDKLCRSAVPISCTLQLRQLPGSQHQAVLPVLITTRNV
jgi:hypothetical protein